MKEYKQKYRDVYVYSRVIQKLIDKSIIGQLSSPYEEDGETVGLTIVGNAVRGYGRRQWQRDKLESERGRVILIDKERGSVLIGVQEKVSNVLEIFLTDTLTELEKMIAQDLIKQLKFNDIKVNVSLDEKRRTKLQIRWRQGDVIQREAGRSGQRDYTDYRDYDEPDDDSGW